MDKPRRMTHSCPRTLTHNHSANLNHLYRFSPFPSEGYNNFKDQETLYEREHIWRDCYMPEETCVFAFMIYHNNVAPEQVLFDAWCTDYQDERAHIAIADAHACGQ
jgi:hypothetical protein